MKSKNVTVTVNTIERVKTFVNVNTSSACEITVKSGKYIVDGKSIMGLFSLDLSHELSVELTAESEAEICSLIEQYKNEKLM